jgi:hypothetical protein
LPVWQKLDDAWQVSFDPKWGAPAHVDFPKLISWTDSSDPGIRDYSGTATYTRESAVSRECDLCKPLLTTRIWKSIELRAYDSRLANFALVQHHDPDGSVRLDLSADLASLPPAGWKLSARLPE